MPNPVRSFFARRHFRPTLSPTLALAVLLAATVSLGNWQRHRGAEKEALREQYELAAREPPLELTGAPVDPAALRFRPVRASGEFDARRQVLIDNKVYAGRPGFNVVTPLRLAKGQRYVLVDRGWIAQGQSRSELPQVPPPAGEISLEGRINLPPVRYLELEMDAGAGQVRQNLDIDRIAAATGLPLLPFVIEQSGDAGDGLVRDRPAPDFGIDQHRVYMVQWYSLAGLGSVLWLALNWRTRGSRDVESRPTRDNASSAGSSPRPPRSPRTLLLLALVALSPIVAAYIAYYGFSPTKRVNYGELLDPAPAPVITGAYLDEKPFALGELRGRWVLLVVSGPGCDDACRRTLHATLVARTIQGPEQDRVVRAWLQPEGAPPPPAGLLAGQPGLVAARAAPADLARLPAGHGSAPRILLLDPRGNLVLRYGDDPDIKRLAKDLERLLRASQIG
jgi:surfeit locus 1 family protein